MENIISFVPMLKGGKNFFFLLQAFCHYPTSSALRYFSKVNKVFKANRNFLKVENLFHFKVKKEN
jgi:hypothetical protein